MISLEVTYFDPTAIITYKSFAQAVSKYNDIMYGPDLFIPNSCIAHGLIPLPYTIYELYGKFRIDLRRRIDWGPTWGPTHTIVEGFTQRLQP